MKTTTALGVIAAALTVAGCSHPDAATELPLTEANKVTCHYRTFNAAKGEVLPDPVCTPGATNPAVTQANIQETICRPGWSQTQRPANLTATKKAVSVAYTGISTWPKTVELDHLISLELGGAPSGRANLFPEPNRSNATSVHNPKDNLENALHRDVCAGRKTLAQAQHAIATDWVKAFYAEGLRNG